MTRKTEEERLADAKAKVERLQREAELKAAAKADREARGPSATALNHLGAEYRLLRRASEIVEKYDFADDLDSDIDVLAQRLASIWRAGLEKKRAYARAHESAQVELARVKPLEG